MGLFDTLIDAPRFLFLLLMLALLAAQTNHRHITRPTPSTTRLASSDKMIPTAQHASRLG